MNKYAARELKRANKARKGSPEVCVTCSASRHTALIGEALAKGKKYHMIDEEPEHVAVSLLSTAASLWKARLEIARLKAQRR